MQPEKDEAQGRESEGLSTENNSAIPSTEGRQKQQGLRRQVPGGRSRWLELDQTSDAGDFLDDWGSSIVDLSSIPETDEQELREEATAWQRAMHAYSNWRAA